MYYVKYESENLYLSPICLDDYQTYTKWINDESLAVGLGVFTNNVSETSEREFLESFNKNGLYNFSIIRKSDNKLIGSYGLELKSQVSRRYHIGGFIGEKEDRGKGYGTEALKLMTKFAFEILNVHSLYSSVFSFNIASLKSAEKAGYKVAGKFSEAYYYNSEYHDEICIELTRSEYDKIK